LIETKINRLKNLIQKIKNEVNWESISNFIEWFYRKIEINFLFKTNNTFYPRKWEIYFVNLWQNIWSELNKIRPCIIYSDRKFNNSWTIVIIPLTSYKWRFNKNFQVKLDSSKICNLKSDSLALPSQIRSISKNRIWEKIWKIENRFLSKIDKIILKTFNIKKDEDL